jgi:Uma2 family endonuclease
MAVQFRRRRFTVAQYHHMAETGLLSEDDRVELIDGEVVELTPIGRRHAAAVVRLTRACYESIGRRAVISPQNPVELDQHGEPQPDLLLLRPRADDYAAAQPTASDVLLLVEVADSSLEYDRQVKLPLYARANIPEVWVEDLVHDVVEVHRDPGPEGYRSVRLVRRGETIQPLAFPDVDIPVDAILA